MNENKKEDFTIEALDDTGSVSKEIKKAFLEEALKLKKENNPTNIITVPSNYIVDDADEQTPAWNVKREDLGLDPLENLKKIRDAANPSTTKDGNKPK
jgi:hypothetical protein